MLHPRSLRLLQLLQLSTRPLRLLLCHRTNAPLPQTPLPRTPPPRNQTRAPSDNLTSCFCFRSLFLLFSLSIGFCSLALFPLEFCSLSFFPLEQPKKIEHEFPCAEEDRKCTRRQCVDRGIWRRLFCVWFGRRIGTTRSDSFGSLSCPLALIAVPICSL
jgi:hypothetical protein